MPTSAIDSVIFRDIFGDADMRRVWSDENRTQRYLDFEAALARAQASIGMISKEAAAEITCVCKVENIDFVQLEKETLNIGYPVLGPAHDIIGERLTMDMTEVVEHHGNFIVLANVDGNYDKRGLPDPLVLVFYFPPHGDQIVQLIILRNRYDI